MSPFKSAIPRFDVYAESYEENIAANGYGVVSACIDWTSPFVSGPGRLLDIGIGTGTASQPYADQGWQVIGLDGSTPMITQAHAKGFASELFRCDLSTGHLPLYGKGFDLFLCAGVLEFVVNLEIFSSEITRLARNDARTVIALVVRDISLNPHFSRMTHNGMSIDKNAYEANDLIAVHYSNDDVREAFQPHHFFVMDEERTFSYKSPTQNIDTRCRVMIFVREPNP